jgi:hypothetical protein
MRCGLRRNLSETERGTEVGEIRSELMMAREALTAGASHQRKVSEKFDNFWIGI